jgi:hypothetical protein
MNLLFHSEKQNKKIIIHDTEGTATIVFQYNVKNISDKSFNTFSRQIAYDGQLDDFKLEINRKKYSWQEVTKNQMVKKQDIGNAYFLKFPLEDKYFHKGDTLNIELQYKVKNIYNKIQISNYEYTLFRFPYSVDKVKLDIII